MKRLSSRLLALSLVLFIRNCLGATPVFTTPNPDGSTTIALDEDDVTGTNVLALAATDADGGTISYSITSQSPGTKFSITGSQVNTADTFDYETPADRTFSITVEATASSDSSVASATFTVNINNVNDETPVITVTTGAVSLNEELNTGTAVGFVFTATDADDGDSLTYGLSGDDTFFQIDSGTGAITTNQPIDFETAGASSFSLTLTVRDAATPSHAATTTLTVTLVDTNDNTPVFNPAIYYVSIPENKVSGFSVQLLTVTDADATDTVTVAIASGDDASAKFTVVGHQIDTSAVAIDYDVLEASDYKYTLVVTGSDTANTGTATVIVTITGVNEHDPVWSTFSPTYTDATTPYDIAESSGIGTTILTILATDADKGTDGEVIYSISGITNSAGGTTTGLFYLDQVTGELTTTSNSFDRDTSTGGNEYFDLTIRATDQGTTARFVERTVRIGLTDYNDNAPTFSQPTYIYSMSETLPASSSLLTLAATDDDESSSLTYSILVSSTPPAYSTHFELDTTNTNQINLKAIVNLDSPDDHASNYILHVEVKDGGSPELTGTTTVFITVTENNDHTPNFAASSVSATVAETSPAGTFVVTMVATDDDEGNDGAITYTISGGNTDNKFSIDSSSGVVRSAGSLDFEDTPQYVLTIHGVDGGGSQLTGIATLTINIGDSSDETPSCTTNSFSVSISEQTSPTTTIATLTCSDDDAIDTLSYSIASGNTGSKFNIDNAGAINLVQVVDYDAGQESFSLIVQVTDGTTTLEIPVDIAVTPVNEAAPTFGSGTTVSVTEDSAVGYTLITFVASDTDSSPHNIIKYKISAVTNSGASLFSIDQTSAVIRLAQALDYESQTEYEIEVVAEDGGGLKGTGTVTVSISNVNDVAPTCNPSSYVLSVPENTGLSTDIIASFGCSDSDSATLTYAITQQTPSSDFTLDTTGTPKLILGTTPLDYETTTGYQIQMTVSDGTGAGSLSTTVFIDISITDVNDGGPSFAHATYTASMSESTPISTSFITITATDPDSSSSDFGKLSYSFTNGNTDNKFSIDPSSGVVSVAGVLDADNNPTYTLVIQAIEASNVNQDTTTLVVTVTNANDNSPVCSSGYTFSVSFAEEGTAGDDMTTLTCSDGDGDTLTYTLTNGGTNFQMNSNVLELKAPIDYDSSPSSEFPVTIQVSDGTNSVNVVGSVTVTSVNENTPVFTQTTYVASHAENSSPGTTISTVAATDADSDASITYQWVSAQTVFTLDQSSGVILLVSSLNRETLDTYSLLVRASDGTSTTTATVALTVTDVNDNTPVFNPNSYSGTVTENAAAGNVLTVTATDLDDPATNNYGTVTYRIASGASGKFNIGSASGTIATLSALDYEDATSYTLYVEAYDSNGNAGALTSTLAITINVDPVNENAPVFTNTAFSATTAEDTPIGTTLVKVSATDADDGDDGVVYYSMTTNANFYLNTGTGDISVKQSLDFEGSTTHTFDVIAHDSGASSLSATVGVTITVTNVNDVAPACSPVLQTFTYQEVATTVSSTIASLTCTDTDSATLAYSITSVNGAASTGIFSVDPNTGVITLATALDYETDTSHSILIQVTDGGIPLFSTTATVQVSVTDYNEADPVFNPATYTATISETTTLSTTVFTVTATDTDNSNTITYSISPANTYFTIDSNNGQVITKSTIDYDTLANPKEIEIIILATDNGASPSLRTSTVTATVTITDNNDITPLFNPGVYTAQISENDAAGTTVTTVTATDSEGTTPTYSLVNDFGIFRADANGDIMINAANQNFEGGTTSYAVIVHATDAASNIGTATVHVTVTNYNEFSPVLAATSQAVSLAENSPTSTVIVDVDATDADSGVDGDITYTIATVPAGYETKFAIVPTTGVVSVAGDLDRESVTNPLTILIEATDSGTTPAALSAQFTLTLTITDENDNTPSCPTSLYTADIAEDIADGITVETIACTDADVDSPNNQITYSITSGDAANHFDIDDSSGVITIATGANIDRETSASYLLTIEAIDGGTSALTGTTSLSITVTDVNDNNPVFQSSTYSFTVSENVALSATIGQVVATDSDSGLAGTLVYSIQNGNVDNNMAIDSNTGELKVVGAFNYESVDLYNLEVIATDSLATIRTGTTYVSISVTDINDVTPSCSPALQTVTFAENTLLTTLIATVLCTDTDTGTNGDVTYVIASVDGVATSTPFTIAPTTGAVSLSTLLDYEADTSKTVIVHGVDGGALTGSATINVVVTNVNDNDPVFTNTPYSQSVSETTAVSISIFKVTATDADVDDVLTYTINPASTVFNIDSSDGTLYLIDTLDFEGTASYEIAVVATDTGSAAVTANVTINVADSNDVIPVFNPAVYVASVSENDGVGTTITTVTATDADSPTLTYSFFSGNGDSVFRIETSGEIIIDSTTNLDYDSAIKSYTLVVHATDGTNTGSTTVAVSVTNYNEATPVLTPTSSTQSLDESTPVGTSIVTVAASDTDHSQDGQITYTISGGNADGRFSINPTSGEVTLASELDMESVQTYVITIVATDGGTNPSAKSAQYTLTVNVQDVNDVTPVCTQSLYSVNVAENTAASTSVLQLACTDSDNASPNSDISNYNIVSGNTGAAFSVTAGGELQVNIAPNREAIAAYTLVVDVIDSGTNPSPLTATTTVAITITDMNDNTPVPGQNPYAFTIGEESTTGVAVGQVNFADSDQGGAGTVSYSINSGNTDNKFSIDSSSGEIKLVGTLDYETASTNPYVLVVLGTDNDAGSPNTGTTTVSITVNDYNDNTPTCTPSLVTVQFPENTPASTALLTLSCSDSDTSNPNNALSYTIVSVNGVATVLPFAVDASGVVTLDAGQTFDFETTPFYRVLMRVSDGGTPSLSFTATFNVDITDVNDFDPVFQSTPFTTNVAETTLVGTSVYSVVATDQDTANTITYSINPSNTYFEIDPVSGDVYTIATIDYDTLATNPITLTVVATDDGATARRTSESLTITVTDANDGTPVFNPGVYSATVSETAAAETTVVTVTVTDVDDTSWTMSFASGNNDNVFRIDANGDIVINDVTNYDYDTNAKSYVLVARAVDAGSNTGTCTVAIQVTNVNDNTPTLTATANAVNIAEDSPIGTSVDDVDGTDADEGSDGTITYSITAVSNGGDNLFTIVPTSGLVSLAGTLDRETQNTYTITIVATDAGTNPGPLSVTYTLTVTVMDVNDVIPVCTVSLYSANIAENTATSVSVAQLACTDADSEANNNLVNSYIITSGNTGTAFAVSNTGEITTAGVLDRETLDNYLLVIEVADAGATALTTTTSLTITVTDENDNAPIFTATTYTLNHDEDVTVGTNLGTVVASDADIGSAGQFVFSIFSGDTDSKFTIDASTGDVVLSASLDFESASNNPYTLIVLATDSGTSALTGTATVIVEVNDKNDNTPVCNPAFSSISVPENTQTTTTLTTLACTDADSGVNGALLYNILTVNGNAPTGIFTIDTSGAIRLTLLLDYETTILHTLLVEVNDTGSPALTTTATVNVHVTNFNDHTPVFTGTPYTDNVIENTAVGISVFQVAATDNDVGDTITFSVNPVSTHFDVGPTSGDIILKAELDYDAVPNTYEVIVEATDDGGTPLTGTATVTISVTNFNDGTPEFNPGVYAVNVAENTAVLATVLTVTITDSDAADTTFSYSIISGDTDNIFDISGTAKTADITVTDDSNLDYDAGSQTYTLIITASDSVNTGTATVNIAVTGINDFVPALASGSSTQNIAENSVIGVTVVDVDATDSDLGDDGSLSYSLISGASGMFAIDPTSGVVTVSGSLDTEATASYNMLIQVIDAGTNPSALSATYTLSVIVMDQNDQTPVCTSSLYAANLAENATPSTSVAQLVCSDADVDSPNNQISTYNIVSGNTGGEFLISSTGEVTTAAFTFDRETTAAYSLVIEVSDSGTTPSTLTTTTTLTITITDVNDNDPTFSLAVYNFIIPEDTVLHTSVGAVIATDADINLAGTFVYSIFSGNGDGKFALDRTTGNITLADSVDYETTTTTPYILTVHVTDMLATFRTGTATVSITLTDVNDNTPVCTASLYAATVAEDASVGTSVVTVGCTDNDALSTVTYSLTSTVFSIGPATGQIDTAAALDVETTSNYALTVTASDGTLSSTVTVTITVTNVNDVTPVFNPVGPYSVNINENEAIGTTVYNINATDGDVSGTTFVFSITAGNTDGIFAIGTSSGIIQQQRSIDRDDPLTTSYTLTVSVADGTGAGALAATTTITIHIDDLNDNAPTCNAYAFAGTVSELTNTGTSLFNPVCSDLDVVASPTLIFSITAGNDDNRFQINGGSGELTLLNLLDYETTTSYTLTIAVDDQGTTNLVTTLYMTVYVDPENEVAPVFTGTPYNSSISESVSLGHQVVRMSATDQDQGSTHGDVRYSIINGNDAGHFSLDASTGWLTVATTLDRESVASYALTVGASDMLSTDVSARTATTVFTITIQDENDNYPRINPATYAVSVNEDAAVSASVVQIIATDDDEGTAGTAGLQYTITAGNTGNRFSMNGTWVTLATTVDAATLANYVLTVKVDDQGTPVLSSFTLVSISVTAINEHAPGFTVSQDTVTLSESEILGSSIYKVPASDADTGDFGTLRYYLTSGTTNSEFNVDQFTGDVRVANSLDYDTSPTVYTLLIEVEDTVSSTSNTLTSTFTLAISLVDANDETPIFTMNLYSGTVNENVPISTSVITVTANDADTGVNSAITYSILSGTGTSTFTIDSSTGVISTSVNIDYETNTLFDLKIQAIDGGVTPLSATCQVQISVNDLNDKTPVFSVVNIAVTIPEDTSIGTTVATAAATDADSTSNNNNVINYAFSVASSVFTIDPNTAAISTTNLLDRDSVPSHTLIVIAVDGGNPVNSATATYTVILSDINDNDPVITGTPYDVTFAEDTAQNTIVLQIQASDPDIDENSFLTYSINSGNTNTDFFIDSGSGMIQISNTLDRETTPVYTLEVVVVDSGTPARSAIVSATVTVGDVNDNSPIFQPDPTTVYTFTVSENVPIGTLVNSVSATDADTGTNAAIQFVIAQYVLGSNTHFTLDAQTGDITTAATLDRETTDTYSFIVRASDGGTSVLTSTVTVSITIDDFNDNIPNFSQTLYTASTTENQAVGTNILTVVIDDLDINVNDDITLSIDTSTTAGARANDFVALDSSTYTLSVKQSIDREVDSTLSFILIAVDGGTPPLSFTTSVEITVGDENDNRPVFFPTFYNSEIPYNDDCQVTATTLTATDADIGVNTALTYAFTQNNNPHLFTLDSNTGAITIVATTAKDTGYIMYASATDGGSPALTSDTGATVRIDTYDPNERVLNYYMDIPQATYLASETTFLSQLTTVYQVTYPTAEAKRWCTAAITASSCVVRVYVIKDDTANEESELSNDKQFLTREEAYAITAADDAGTPASVIDGVAWTSFVITRVEKYMYVAPEEETPWIETTTGIIVITVVCVVAVIIILAVAFGIYMCREKTRHNRVEVGDDEDGGDHVAKNQYYPKTRQMQTSQLEKPLGKGGPYPTVVSLPTPTAVKKVPLQATKHHPPAQDFKDFNLHSSYKDGPTLVKSPPKLRPSSPLINSTVVMQRPLAPTNKPATKPPAYSLQDGVGPAGPGDYEKYMVTNREFDGRAIDPKTGRMYEYNTSTNERRWLDPTHPPSTRATLRRDDDNDLYQSSSES